MSLDRIRSALEAFIRQVTSRIDFLALYPARVVAQHPDGTLEVQPDDARLAGLARVPIRYGLPGVSATVEPGARVLLGFEGGDPSRPIATLWELTGATLVFNGGTQKVAREGDSVDCGKLIGTTPSGPVVFTYFPPGTQLPDPLPVPGATPVSLTGTITSGADRVKA